MRNLFIAGVALVLLPLALFGQAFTSLTGLITDPTGAVVPGATVTIVNTQTGVQRETISNAEGRYSFPQVTPGTYQVIAKTAGFADVNIKAVQLLVNSPATVNLTFEKLGAVTQTVTVEAAAIQVNTTDASLGNAVGTQAILELPFFARNVVNLLQLQPGVVAVSTDDTDQRNGAVNGGKSDQANVTLDGVDVNDQANRSAFTSVLRVTLDSVSEFRTTTTNSNADSGRGSGADVALVTKMGTNEIHGSAYEYNRNELFAANSFFSNRTTPVTPRGALKINVFGGSIGGPVKKNKLFFFMNYEGRRDASAAIVNRTVPTESLKQGIVTFRNKSGQTVQVGPDQIKNTVDPLHIGVDPAVLKIFQMYPVGNNPAVGDSRNTIGYRFNAPQYTRWNTYIARLDYNVDDSGKNQIFLRGNLQNDNAGGTPQFPGRPPNSVSLDNSKGLATGWTSVLRPNMVNTVRYGFTRMGRETAGNRSSSWTSFRGFDTIYGTTASNTRIVPVHNVSEDFAWTKGAHDLRFGAAIRLISNQSSTNASSFHNGVTNASGLLGSGKAITPADFNVSSADNTSYTFAMCALLGLISQVTANYNYTAEGKVLPFGAPVLRDFVNREYEMYAQDSWRIRRNLTVTAGLRYSLMPPVFEGNGQQISTDIPIAEWLGKRAALAAQGLSQEGAGDLTYVLASSAQGRSMYPYHKNWSPRIGLAWSPSPDKGFLKTLFGGEGKTAIRAGFGMFYDVIGQPLANTFNANSFGLNTSIGNPMNSLGPLNAPRFTDFWAVPIDVLPPPPPAGFPTRQPRDSFAITGSIDDQLRAPYTMNMNFSWGREFAHGLFIQGSYVGRLSRHSLIQRDLAMPTNLKDPKSGQTYFQAVSQLGTLMDLQGVPVSQLPKIPFFENLWGNVAAGGLTATQVIASDYYDYVNQGDFTTLLSDIDGQGCIYYTGLCSNQGPWSMFNSQFGALSGWSSIGSGAYHAGQLTIRKRFSEGLLFDFNYTLGKSIDMSSVAERSGTFSGFITNTWGPGQMRAVSNYDTTHAVNAYAVWKLPFGRGMRFGSQMNKWLDAIVGGWQVSGIYRQTSGLPYSVSDGARWSTNWQLSDWGTPNGKPLPPSTNNKNAQPISGVRSPNLFDNPQAALDAYWIESLPGNIGVRNNIRGAGYFNIDSLVAKSFNMPYKEGHQIQIRWESFNLTNSVRLGAPNMSLTDAGNFGKITGQLGSPRQMQFAFRYIF